MAKTMSKQQADEIIRQGELEDLAGETLESFIQQGGEEIEPYFSGEVAYTNARTVTQWAVNNLPQGPESLTAAGAWQIAFRSCKNSLQKDPQWLSSEGRAKLFDTFWSQIPASLVKKLLGPESVGPEQMSAEAWRDLTRIGGQHVFQDLSNRVPAQPDAQIF